MYVRCTHCGHDNGPEYRFCGMCGTSLEHPSVGHPPTEGASQVRSSGAVDGGAGRGDEDNVPEPSFRGLAEAPRAEFHSLYEDEQPHSHLGVVIFLLIIFGAAGFLGWQWRHAAFRLIS